MVKRFKINCLWVVIILLIAGSCVAVNPQPKIVFSSDRNDDNDDIYIINSDGTGEKQLTHSEGDDNGPACSPDGRRIAFTSTGMGTKRFIS